MRQPSPQGEGESSRVSTCGETKLQRGNNQTKLFSRKVKKASVLVLVKRETESIKRCNLICVLTNPEFNSSSISLHLNDIPIFLFLSRCLRVCANARYMVEFLMISIFLIFFQDAFPFPFSTISKVQQFLK